MTTEIKVGQTWMAKRADKLKSNSQVTVLSVVGDWVEVEGFLERGGVQSYPKRWISPEGLRRRYRLEAQQESLDV